MPEPTPAMTHKEKREERHEERHEERQKNKGEGEIHSGSALKNFDAFLDAHPGIQSDLRGNPQLANDPNYIKSHSDYQTFLKSHPYVHEELKKNPAGTINRENKYEKKHD